MNMITKEFEFESSKIRTIKVRSTVWAVAKDIMVALGYSPSTLTSMTQKIKHVPEEWKSLHPMSTKKGVRDLWCLSEQGVYFFLARSDKPKALPFQKWLAGTVVPAIMNEGAYIAGEEKVATGELSEDEFIMRAMEIMHSKLDRLKRENESLVKSNKEMSDELNILTVNEFIALSHRYMSHGQKVKIGRTASELCRIKGITIEKQDREIETKWEGNKQVQVNVYPREILEEALHLSEVLDYNKIAQVR